jgi:hypothetical protein
MFKRFIVLVALITGGLVGQSSAAEREAVDAFIQEVQEQAQEQVVVAQALDGAAQDLVAPIHALAVHPKHDADAEALSHHNKVEDAALVASVGTGVVHSKLEEDYLVRDASATQAVVPNPSEAPIGNWKQIQNPDALPQDEGNQALAALLMGGASGESQLGGDNALKNLFAIIQVELAKQQKMVSALTPELRQRMEELAAQHADFVAKVHAPDAMYKLGADILTMLGEPVDGEPASITHVRKVLAQDLELLRAGIWGAMFDSLTKNYKTDVRDMLGDMFSGLVAGGTNSAPMLGLVGGMNPAEDQAVQEPYSMEELAELAAALAAAEVEFKQGRENVAAFDHFKKYVDALVAEDIHKLALAAFAYLEPEYLLLAKELYSVQEQLLLLFDESTARAVIVDPTLTKEARLEQAITRMKDLLDDEQSIRLYSDNPYFYWLTQLKNQENGIATYATIKRRFNTAGISQDYFQFFRLFAHSYTFVNHFFDFYQDEARSAGVASRFDIRRVVPTLMNFAITSSAAATYFFNVREVARNTTYYGAILEKGCMNQPERLDIQAMMAECISIAAAAPTFAGSPLFGIEMQTRMKKNALHLGAAWAYYYIFYNGLFNRNGFFRPDNKPDAGEMSLWPMEFGGFRDAFMSTLSESVDYLSYIAEVACYNKLNPEIVADVDDFTFGLINPAALRHVTRAFLPMALLSPVGSVLRGNMDQAAWDKEIRETFGLHSAAYAAGKGMSPAGLYAENRLVRYACSTVGYNAGYWVGDYFNDEISSGVKKALRGACKVGSMIGIGMDDNAEVLARIEKHSLKAVQDITDVAIKMLKMLLWAPPAAEQTLEPVIRGYLMEYGYLDINDDKNAYREAVVKMVLMRLAISGVTTHYNATIYSRMFKKEPTQASIDIICGKLVTDAKKHLVSMGVGFFGQWLLGAVGNELHKQYGPITPKVRALFN